ncbi:uncharacterized protein AAGF69_011388 isoform 1-T1 [Amazona ochrocephala]
MALRCCSPCSTVNCPLPVRCTTPTFAPAPYTCPVLPLTLLGPSSPSALLPALVSGSLLHGPHLGATVQPHRKTTLILLAAQPSPCGGEEAKTCIHRVLKPLLPRKVLKRRRHRILQLQVPACQSWWVLLTRSPQPPTSSCWRRARGPSAPRLCPGSERGPRCPEPCATAALCCSGQHPCTLLLGFCLRLFQHLQELEEEAASRTQVGLQVEPMEVDMVEEEEAMEVDRAVVLQHVPPSTAGSEGGSGAALLGLTLLQGHSARCPHPGPTSVTVALPCTASGPHEPSLIA